MSRIIGIDLGTTNSCVSVMEGGKPVIIANAEGLRTTPSVVAFTKNGERLVGETARRQAVTNAPNTISSIKRHMGSDYKVELNGRKYTPQEISAMILQKLKADAEAYVGGPITEAVITVPAYFNDAQRQATKDAGKIAGLNVRRIINEPTSAALAYGLDHGESQKIMVYDLGGGTFDVSIIDIGDGIIEVLATNGDTHLGGDDFDAILVDYIIKTFKQSDGIDLSTDSMALQRIRDAAEKAKKELSSSVQANINLPFITANADGVKHLNIDITRAKFNELTHALVEHTAGPVNNALRDAGLNTSDIDKVLLVGGSTRIPAVQEKVKELIGKEPSKGINPDECVALGAALQGGNLENESCVDTGLLLLDVTPLSLSIETMGGIATKLIERNTTIPTRKSQIFSTASDNQSSVDINVLQGERTFAKDNKSLGQFRLDGIPPAKRGVPQIEVTFDIDANGIVNVYAKDLGTGKEQHITITSSSNMSDADIDKAINDAQRYEAEDKKRKEKINTYNDCEGLVGKVETTLNNFKGRVADSDLKAIEERVEKLKSYLNNDVESLNEYDVENMQRLQEDILSRVQDVSEKVYNNVGSNGSSNNSNNFNEDNIVDADFTEVD